MAMMSGMARLSAQVLDSLICVARFCQLLHKPDKLLAGVRGRLSAGHQHCSAHAKRHLMTLLHAS